MATLFFRSTPLKVIAVPRFVQNFALLTTLALLLAGCGSSSSEDTPKGDEPSADCEGRGEDFTPGARASTRDENMTLELLSATPEVPSNTDNFWSVTLSDADARPIDDATIVAVPYMVDHGHGTAPQLATAVGEGRYDIGPVTLTMPGFWEITLEVTLADGTETSAIYPICVQPK